jgi:hypothetical protein
MDDEKKPFKMEPELDAAAIAKALGAEAVPGMSLEYYIFRQRQIQAESLVRQRFLELLHLKANQ